MGDFLFVFVGTKYNIFVRVAAVQPAPATAVLCEFINLGDFGWGDGIFALRKMPKRGTIPGVQGQMPCRMQWVDYFRHNSMS